MATELEWTATHEPAVDSVESRSFRLILADRTVPGTYWRPAGASATPAATVLLGHGGSGHKRIERHERMGCWLATRVGLSSIAIDGPYHGDRVGSPVPAAVYQGWIVREGIGPVVDRMVADWLGVLDGLGDLGIANPDRVGYFGVSMGGRFGVPTAAALGARLGCLVIGKFGIEQSALLDPGLLDKDRLLTELGAIAAPALVHIQREDELFPLRGQRAMYDAVGSPVKEIAEYPGRHGDAPPESEQRWLQHLSRHLGTDG